MRLGIALGHGLVRQGAEGYLASHSTFILLDVLDGAPAAVDVILTDQLSVMPSSSCLEAAIVLCANLQDRIAVIGALAAGAQACVSTHSRYQHLILAIQSALEGRQYLCPTLSAIMCKSTCPTDAAELTSRESDVLQWISIGYSTKQIGRTLGISPHTVDTHRRSIMQKLGAHKAAELTRYAMSRERNAQTVRQAASG